MADTNSKFGFVAWTVCVIAAIGFAFDTYELLMLPLIIRPALLDLAGIEMGTPDAERWVAYLLFIPSIAGGIFGLLGGYLTDILGRRRVLTGSILLYAFSALAAGFATSLEWLLFLRCTTLIGVCVEFVAATAWLAELFVEPHRREKVLGYTQAFASFGGILVTAANALAISYGNFLPEIYGGHEAWRYTLISGVIPAIPLLIVRPFLPESPVWKQKKEAGTLRRPSILELFSPKFARVTIVTTLLFACCYGVAFGALQQVPRMVPTFPEVKEAAAKLPEAKRRPYATLQGTEVNAYQEFGGLAGRFLLATLAIFIVSRRTLLWMFQIPSLLLIPVVFYYAGGYDLEWMKWGIFASGLLTIGQFSFWGNYMPRVFPVRLRGTGESFAANIGGRVMGTSAAAVTSYLVGSKILSHPHAAAAVALFVCVLGVILTLWLPQPPPEGELDAADEAASVPHA